MPRILLLLVLLLSLMLNCALIGRFIWTRPSRLRTAVIRMLLVAFPSALVLLVLELLSYQLLVFSDGFGVSLASQRWMQRYWHPVNLQGMRDSEHSPGELAEHDVLVVVGDSFAAGHGIEQVQDRFANVLAERLGPSWQLVLLAQNGWHTGQQLEALRQLPARPRVIVCSYYINDIEGAARAHGRRPPELELAPRSGWWRALVERSYLANYFYWRWRRSADGSALLTDYVEYLRSCYGDPAIWQTHRAQLLALAAYAREQDAVLLAVVFPHLRLLEQTQDFAHQAADVFRAAGAEVLEVTSLLPSVPAAQRVVNRYDAHPSRLVHRQVARALETLVRTRLEGDRKLSSDDKQLSSDDRMLSHTDKKLSPADRPLSHADRNLPPSDRKLSLYDRNLSPAGGTQRLGAAEQWVP